MYCLQWRLYLDVHSHLLTALLLPSYETSLLSVSAHCTKSSPPGYVIDNLAIFFYQSTCYFKFSCVIFIVIGGKNCKLHYIRCVYIVTNYCSSDCTVYAWAHIINRHKMPSLINPTFIQKDFHN